MEFSRQGYWNGLPFLSPGDLPNPGIEPRSPTFLGDSLLPKSHGKPKNTGVGSLPLLQGIFLTQESSQGLLHCRQILYQLSYQGGPEVFVCLLVILSCMTLCSPMDCSPPDSSALGILQARILEWVANPLL